MTFIDNHPSVIFLGVMIISLLVLNFRFMNYSEEKPSLKKGYSNLLLGYLIVLGIPVVILVLSEFIGEIKLINLKVTNPYSIALQIYGVLFVLVGIYWIYVKDGAKFLSEHPGLLRFRFVFFRENITNTFYIKSICIFLWISILFVIFRCWIL
jgi:hypothetical protein